MPGLKFTFTDTQVTRIKSAVRDKYGDDERTDAQLVKDEIMDHLKSLVRNYEKKIAIDKLNLASF